MTMSLELRLVVVSSKRFLKAARNGKKHHRCSSHYLEFAVGPVKGNGNSKPCNQRRHTQLNFKGYSPSLDVCLPADRISVSKKMKF